VDRNAEQPAGGFYSLASGSSHRWRVDVDESLERAEWFVDLDGPNLYLTFQIHDLNVIQQTIDFLQRHLSRAAGVKQPSWTEEEDAIRLGTFAQASVELLWDDEGNGGCFLVDSPAHEAMRLTLHRDDVEMLLEALHQVAKDLAEEAK
jgi:hypothetical protein